MRNMLVILVAVAAAMSPVLADDFEVITASYLGGPGQCEQWSAVAHAPDGTLVVAGMMSEGGIAAVRSTDLLGGGSGIVMRLAGDGTQVLSVTRLGDWIDDMAVAPDGRIAIIGSFGAAMLSPDASSIAWRDAEMVRGTAAAQFSNLTPPFRHARYIRRVSRIDVGSDGTVAAIASEHKVHGSGHQGRLYIWDSSGKRISETRMSGYKYPKDICVASAQKLVIVGGFNTYAADSKHMKNHPIHMPFLSGYKYDGQPAWKSYDFTAAATYAQNTFADSRVQRLAIGADGLLYMGGYIHGGDYVWAHHAKDVTQRVKVDTGYDNFSRASNMGKGLDHAYFARIDPATGDMLAGQALLTRVAEQGGGKPAQIQIRGITADADGNVYMSGYAEKFIKDRSAKTINGQAVGEYHKSEAFVLVVSPDMRQRKVWSVFSKDQAESAAWGMSVSAEGKAALVGEVYEGTLITTDNALIKERPAPYCGYIVTWQARP